MDSKDNVNLNSNRCNEGMELLSLSLSSRERKELVGRYTPPHPHDVPMSQDNRASGWSAGYEADGSDAVPQTMGRLHLGMAAFCEKYDIDESWTWHEALNAMIEESVEYIIVHDGNLDFSKCQWTPNQIQDAVNLVDRRVQKYLKAHGYASREEAKADLVKKGLGRTGSDVAAWTFADK